MTKCTIRKQPFKMLPWRMEHQFCNGIKDTVRHFNTWEEALEAAINHINRHRRKHAVR